MLNCWALQQYPSCPPTSYLSSLMFISFRVISHPTIWVARLAMLLCCLTILGFTFPLPHTNKGDADNGRRRLKFVNSSYEAFKVKAATEGKPYFVQFASEGCVPCKLMNESAFSDDRIITYTDANYMAFEASDEVPEGLDIRQQYDVQNNPTTIFFNSQGEELGRVVGSIATSLFYEKLKEYDKPENRIKVPSTEPDLPPPSPRNATYGNNAATHTTTPPSATGNPPRPFKTPVVLPPNTAKPTSDLPPPTPAPSRTAIATNNSTKPAVASVTNTTPPSFKKAVCASTADGLYEFRVKRADPKGFSLQVGVWQQLAFTLEAVAKVGVLFPDVTVFVYAYHETNAKTGKDEERFRVMVGSFKTAQEANEYKSVIMAKYNNNEAPIIKDLSKLPIPVSSK